MTTGRDYLVYVLIDGQRYHIVRDVAHVHPPEVHAALGTASEAELQHALDQCRVADYYDPDGRHKGPDSFGLVMEWVQPLHPDEKEPA